jgi:hypothetical protein
MHDLLLPLRKLLLTRLAIALKRKKGGISTRNPELVRT